MESLLGDGLGEISKRRMLVSPCGMEKLALVPGSLLKVLRTYVPI